VFSGSHIKNNFKNNIKGKVRSDEQSLPCFAEAPSEAEGEVEGSVRPTRACLSLRTQAQKFCSQSRVVLGQAQVAHFVGGGLGADDFGGVFFFLRRPAVEIRDHGED
jgi:hypothetical protein